jgi:hypothetical protein
MGDTPILRFRRRARDGSTRPLLSPGQAESIAESLLAGEREERAKKAARVHPLHDVECLGRIAPVRRAAIVAAARNNVNNRWTTALVIGVPMAIYGAVMWIWADVIPDLVGIALPVVLFGPAVAVHVMLVRREVEALAQREPAGE